MPSRREPSLPAHVDITVLLVHLMLLATQIVVATRFANNTGVIVHIILVGAHSMVRDIVKVVH